MARKGWDALSPGYRGRIEKAGMSRADYEAGQSLKKARGHERTPDRPKSYDAKQYPQYDQERKQLEKDVAKQKHILSGDRPKWNPKKSAENLKSAHKPMSLLREIAGMTKDEMWDAIHNDPEKYGFLLHYK